MANCEFTVRGYRFAVTGCDELIIKTRNTIGVADYPRDTEAYNNALINAVRVAGALNPIVYALDVVESHTLQQYFYGKSRSELRQLRDLFRGCEFPDVRYASPGLIGHIIDEIERQERQEMLDKQVDKNVNPASGYVYCLKSVSGHYKIGKTVNPDNRLKTFTVKLPFEVEYEVVIPTGNRHQLESLLHKRFASKRIGNTEWFNLAADDVALIKSLAVQS